MKVMVKRDETKINNEELQNLIEAIKTAIDLQKGKIENLYFTVCT